MSWNSNDAICFTTTNEIDRLTECRTKFGNSPSWATIVKDTIIDNVYFAAMKSTKTGKIWALIVNTYINDKDFFYNAMNETHCPYPYFCFCPKFILKWLSPTNSEHAKKWREHCYKYHERQQRKKIFAKTLKTAKRIRIILPDDYNGENYKARETVLLSKYDEETWLDPVKKLIFDNSDVCEYGFTVIE